jgi:hypothetical protein
MKKSLKETKKIFPDLKPTLANGFTLNGKNLIITCEGENLAIVVDNNTDLNRLLYLCQMAIENS